MARFFGSIGASVFGFFDADKYQLSRTTKVEVNGGKTNWSVEWVDQADGSKSSTLEASIQCKKERLSVTAPTNDNPTFSVNTNRLSKPGLDVTASLKDPNLELGVQYQRKNITGDLMSSFNWASQDAEAELGLTLKQKKVVFGANVKVERSGNGTMNTTDYGVAVELRKNDRQTFAIATEQQFGLVKFGAALDLKKGAGYTGYAQISVTPKNDSNGTEVDWSVGLSKELSERSSLSTVYQRKGEGSVLYSATLPRFTGEISYNFDIKNLGTANSVQYKLVFGK